MISQSTEDVFIFARPRAQLKLILVILVQLKLADDFHADLCIEAVEARPLIVVAKALALDLDDRVLGSCPFVPYGALKKFPPLVVVNLLVLPEGVFADLIRVLGLFFLFFQPLAKIQLICLLAVPLHNFFGLLATQDVPQYSLSF